MQTINLIGFVGRDPEKKEVHGRHFWQFSLGVTVRQKKEEHSQWYDVSIWDPTLDGMMEKIKKGNHLSVIGPLGLPYVYTGKDGSPKVKMSVRGCSLQWISSPKREETSEGKYDRNLNPISQDPLLS